MPEAIAAFALEQSQRLGNNADTLLRTAPKLVLSPLNYTLVNLKPFDIQVYVALFLAVDMQLTDLVHTGRRRLISSVSFIC